VHTTLPVALVTVAWVDERSLNNRCWEQHLVVMEGDYLDAVLDDVCVETQQDEGFTASVTVLWFVDTDEPVGTPEYWERVTTGNGDRVYLDCYSGRVHHKTGGYLPAV